MQVALDEAKDGNLHNKLKASISKEYGIPADHKAWNTIRPQASIGHYTEAVYGAFPDEIDGRHNQADFRDFVSAAHHDLTNTKGK